MKSSLLLCTLVCATAGITIAQDVQPPKEEKDRISYAIGTDIGGTLKKQGIEFNPEMLFNGIRDANAGGKLLMSDDEMQQTMQAFQTKMQEKMSKQKGEAGAKNKTEGVAYLENNKKKEGVKTLPSGLQYKVLSEGKGEKPKASDSVTTHYRGTLIDGTEFDSSYKRNEPASFPVTGVIPGWTEALQLMPVGSKWQLAIPSELAYGENGPPPIGPNSTLLFDIELLKIDKGATADPAAVSATTPPVSSGKKKK